jgi:hypothetical protein
MKKSSKHCGRSISNTNELSTTEPNKLGNILCMNPKIYGIKQVLKRVHMTLSFKSVKIRGEAIGGKKNKLTFLVIESDT